MGRVLTNNFSLAMAIEEALGVADGTPATGTLTFTGQPLDTETVTIDTKVYTFQTVLTNVDGNVLIGATTADSISNLLNAIILGPGAGTAYAAATTLHPTVTATATATTLDAEAKSGGTPGNSIATTETLTNANWGGATLSGGTNPVVRLLEPNSVNQFGAEITTTPRNPISKKRQRRKGSTTDLDSAVEFEHDLTLDIFERIAECFVFSTFRGYQWNNETGGIVVDGTNDEYEVPDLSFTPPAGTLLYGSGFTNSANNGVKEVDAGATGTVIPVLEDLVAEASPPAGATVEVAGFRGATGDLQIDSAGDLISTVLDFTTLPLLVGQAIHVGGVLAANRFTAAPNFGFARVTAIAANKLTLDKKATTFVTDTGAGKRIDILFGRFLRNVSVDDADYSERSVMFEGSYPNLAAGGATAYEYAKGNYCNQLQFNLALTSLATITAGFVGTDTDPPTSTRKNGFSSAVNPVKTGAFNTSADILRLRITQVDETGLTTDFKSATLTLNNNVSPEKVLAQLGAKFLNTGNFDVDVESQLLFTSEEVPAAIRNNTTVTMDFALRNDEGAIFFDLPSVTIGGGGKDLPVNESILLNTTVAAFEDVTLGTSIGISTFPVVPAS